MTKNDFLLFGAQKPYREFPTRLSNMKRVFVYVFNMIEVGQFTGKSGSLFKIFGEKVGHLTI